MVTVRSAAFPMSRAPAARRPWLTEPRIVFLLFLALYLAAGAYLVFHSNVVEVDAWSRVEKAERVMFSRDPHLGAIGFVWSPLPVLSLMPLVALKGLWPQLVSMGFASNILSAGCMAGCVVQLRRILDDQGLGRFLRLTFTAAFGLQPLVVFFGSNGMSEAILLLVLMLALRALALWLRTPRPHYLVATGLALMVAYFTRYEAVAAASGITAIVAVAGWKRTPGVRGERLSRVAGDLLIVIAPIAMAFAVWAIASWLITGNALEQFTSVYVNRTKTPTGYVAWHAPVAQLTLTQLVMLEPLLIAVALIWVFARPANGRALALASVGCLGSTLAFMALAAVNVSITNELRYFIGLIPFTVLLAASSIPTSGPVGKRSWVPRRLTIGVVLLATFAALPISAIEMLDAGVDPYSAVALQAALSPGARNDVGGRLNWATERKIASDLDGMHLRRGAVLVDDYLGFPIVASSEDPQQFVTTSDRDFQSALADPKGTGVQFMLVPGHSYLGDLDAVNRQYPGLFENGAGIAAFVHEYPQQGKDDNTWRLYRVKPPVT